MSSTSRAIAALVEIMRNNEAMLPRRRIEACEHLLDYECPRAVIEEAKVVLLSIVEDGETPVDIKLDALKLLRRVESRKVIPGRAAVREVDIEIARAVEILRRRTALVRAGIFPFPDGYADDLYAADYVPMPASDDHEPAADLAVALRNARLAQSASVRKNPDENS
jgi:hypothetical protein